MGALALDFGQLVSGLANRQGGGRGSAVCDSVLDVSFSCERAPAALQVQTQEGRATLGLGFSGTEGKTPGTPQSGNVAALRIVLRNNARAKEGLNSL